MMRIILVASTLSLIGCAGASTEVVAPKARVPVSLSRGVRDADGELVSSSRQQVVGKFEQKSTSWGMAYSLVGLTPKTDLSTAINDQVDQVKGQAVVRLAVLSQPCALNFVPVLVLLPFWPGCSKLVATGEIVRVRPKNPPPVVVSPPPPVPTMPEPAPPAPKHAKARVRKVGAR